MDNNNEIRIIESLLSAKEIPDNITFHILVGENEKEIVVSEKVGEEAIAFYKATLNYEKDSQNPQLNFEVIPDIMEHLETMNLTINSESISEKGESSYARKK